MDLGELPSDMSGLEARVARRETSTGDDGDAMVDGRGVQRQQTLHIVRIVTGGNYGHSTSDKGLSNGGMFAGWGGEDHRSSWPSVGFADPVVGAECSEETFSLAPIGVEHDQRGIAGAELPRGVGADPS